jgi:hypothetical protein
MTSTSTLLAELRAAHPDLTFETVDKAETAHADESGYASTLVGVIAQDVLIVDPLTSSCGRFCVTPEEAHGIPESVAKLIVAHNCVPAGSSTPNP